EREWAHYQPFLEGRGYMLRPRYRPGWVPEAIALGKSLWECEDSKPCSIYPSFADGSIATCRATALDATCVADGGQVVLKIVEMGSQETVIAEFLAKEPDAEKHTIQMLELIPMYDDPSRALMVMPRMRAVWDTPLFKTVHEFLEFAEQVLQGLAFLHSKNIAHRDICTKNLVMDASRMIPAGFHFIATHTSDGVQLLHFDADDSDPLVVKSRTRAGPMRYAYIDFGLSVHFLSIAARELVTGECGQLREHMRGELSETVPYDAFKADVRFVGEMIRTEFLCFHEGLDFLIPLVKKLCRRDPARRPDAAMALALFQSL
ncbi:hypothetical protein FB451DRAFT_944957, partial [Mycena latifolia]